LPALLSHALTPIAPKEPKKIEFYRILRKPAEMKGWNGILQEDPG